MLHPVHSQFKVDAQIRNRFELRHGYRKPVTEGSEAAAMIWQRSRLTFSFQSDDLKLIFTPQDVRLWGDESVSSSTGIFGDNASLELFEAYTEIRIVKPLWLSVGRQQLKYDNQRLLAARNWNNQGLSYDAVVLKFSGNSMKVHVGSTWNSLEEASTGNLYPSNRIKTLSYLWLNNRNISGLNFSFLHVSSGVTETDTTGNIRFRHTSGLYSIYENDNLRLQAEGYFQYGKNPEEIPVRAYLAGLDISNTYGRFITGTGIVFLSGNRYLSGDLSTDRRFDILYGGRHRFYGGMDYFRDFTGNTAGAGLRDYYAYIEYVPFDAFRITNSSHYFQLSELNPGVEGDRNLGFENDLVINHRFKKWVVAEIGYLFLVPGETLLNLHDTENPGFQHFLYLQLTITPVIFEQPLNPGPD